MTLKDTPTSSPQAGVAGLEFNDEVKTANALVPGCSRKGVKAIVVLIHQGGTPSVQKWPVPTARPTTPTRPTTTPAARAAA